MKDKRHWPGQIIAKLREAGATQTRLAIRQIGDARKM